VKIHAPGINAKLAAMIVNSGDSDAVRKLDQHVTAWLGQTKADIIRAHPDLHPREIRKRYGISVNHVRVQRAQDKAKWIRK